MSQDSIEIREVWNHNLDEEFALIRDIVDEFPYVAVASEFPDAVIRPVGNFENISDFNYKILKDNVDMLNLIRLGLTFSDEDGKLPTCGSEKCCVWQFNFDVFAGDSIESTRFAKLLTSYSAVMNFNMRWVTFNSGYDFGYLLKLLTGKALPETKAGFLELIKTYFPTVYDIKHLMKFCDGLDCGLNELAELLEVKTVGVCHPAGSDSLFTCCTFMKLKENFFNGPTERYAGVLHGLGRIDES